MLLLSIQTKNYSQKSSKTWRDNKKEVYTDMCRKYIGCSYTYIVACYYDVDLVNQFKLIKVKTQLTGFL